MTSSRPPASEVARRALMQTKDDIEQLIKLKVVCRECGTRVGIVISTEHGLLWLGWLGANKARRGLRQRLVGAEYGRGALPYWVESWRGYYGCECECRRNAVDGPPVWAALQAGTTRITVAAQV
jgi:hypothetical protein